MCMWQNVHVERVLKWCLIYESFQVVVDDVGVLYGVNVDM